MFFWHWGTEPTTLTSGHLPRKVEEGDWKDQVVKAVLLSSSTSRSPGDHLGTLNKFEAWAVAPWCTQAVMHRATAPASRSATWSLEEHSKIWAENSQSPYSWWLIRFREKNYPLKVWGKNVLPLMDERKKKKALICSKSSFRVGFFLLLASLRVLKLSEMN